MKFFAGTVMLLFTISSLLIPAHALISQPSLLIADDSLPLTGGLAVVPLNSPIPGTWFVDPTDVLSQQTDLVSDGTDVFVISQGVNENTIAIAQINLATQSLVATLPLPSDTHFDSEFSFLNGIDRDSFGNIFIAAENPDNVNGVYKYDSSNNYVGAFYTNFVNPFDVAVDSSDKVWVLDYGASDIIELDHITNSTTPLAVTADLSNAQKMVFVNQTHLAITDFFNPISNSQILLLDTTDGSTSVLSADPSFNFLTGIAFNSTSKDVFVIDQQLFGIPKVFSLNLNNPSTINTISSGPPLTVPLGMILTNIQIANANLELTKSGPQFIPEGHEFNYTITITNDGPDQVSDVTIKDTHPPGILFASADPDVCDPKPTNPPTVDCVNLGTIQSGESIEIILTFEINDSQPPTTFPLTNTAKLSTGAIGNLPLDDEDSTNILGIISGNYCGVDIEDYDSIILGTNDNDLLVGTNNDDLIIGLGGDDEINGNDGNDCIIGDDTNNLGLTGIDTINGGDGDDEIHGGPLDDILNGNDGDDKIFGEDNKDTINGGDDDDEIHGGDNDDILNGNDGDDKIFGGDDLDEIDGGDGVDLCDEGALPNVVVNCEADLEILLTGTPNPVTVGNPLTYSVSIKNLGPNNATDVSVSFSLNSTVLFNTIISSGSFTCNPTLPSVTVLCTAPILLESASSQTISFTVTPGVAGIINASAQATSDFIDHDPSNSEPEISTTVLPIVTNNPPIAVADSFTVLQDSTSNNLNVLANDIDVDNDPLFVSSVTTPNNGGTVTINGTGNGINYTPVPGFFGIETFTYIANDTLANSLPATVSVSVTQTFCGLPQSAFDNVIYGTPGNDKIVGTHGNDLIFGLAGNDKINGLKGNDCIFGGDGDDKINGNPGNDTIFGGNGNDKLNGNHGNDKIHGGDGKDDIKGNNGNDELFGDDGKDKIYGGNGDDFIDGGPNTDKCKGGKGNNTIINCEDSKLEKADKDDKDKKDKEDCDCEKPSIFTVSFSGPNDVAVEIYQKENYVGNEDKILAELDVENGEITIHSEDDLDQNKLDSNTVYRIIDEDGNTIDIISIHTSCSQPLFQGQQFIGTNGVTLTVISGTDLDDNSTIPTDQCKIKNDDKNKPKDDKNKPKDDKNKPKDDKNKPKDDKNKPKDDKNKK